MPVESNHGRGSNRNPTPARFNLKERVVEGEWLDQVEALDGVPKRRTTVTIEHPKSILTRNSSPDIGFDRSINAYRGCEHGCIYCFARPTHAYHDLSPGVDFESRLFVKPNASQLLHTALSRPGYECRPIAMGTNTDPYQPIEDRWRITRSVIELLVETRHPFTITTKSDRVLRDLDLLKQAADLQIASVALSVTSLDPKIARTLEPRAPRPQKRLAAMKALNEAGIPCFVAIAPVVPQVTDMSSSTSSKLPWRPVPRAASICRSAFPMRSHLCSARGSTSISRTAPRRSCRRSVRSAAAATTIPISSAACAARDPGPIFFERGSKLPARNMA